METPSWLNKANIKTTLDARPMLASGEHPLERVIQETAGLMPGEIFEIITPFPPMPMIEKLKALGFENHTETDNTGLFHTYFSR
jgi:hypothetical protein